MEFDKPIQSEQIRQYIRKIEECHRREVALNKRDGAHRTTLMTIAFDEYEVVPDTYVQMYYPDEHMLVCDLPMPASRLTQAGD